MRTSASLTPLRLAVAVSALALVLSACGGSSSSPSSETTGSITSKVESGASGNAIAVTLKDFSISLARMPSAAGTYTFDVSNQGPSAHNLTVNGPGVSGQTTGTFSPSDGTKTLTVTLQNGKYDFYCSVPGHKAAGMNVEVTIGSS
ncbi:MAG: plastocyanin/azurin family copper-binding protein [Gaiellales bacterium]